MKSLRKMKIINWHYFWNETISFETINFLTGANASGKSTLIDAMQLLLLGETSGRYFNKAASDKSTRTLKGYLRGELGDIEEGGFNYLRSGRFTSYLAMEFYDDKIEKSFTFGCVFDCFDDGTEEHRFFLLEDKIPDGEFVELNIPMDYKTLVNYFKYNFPGKHQFFDSNRQYTDMLKRRFGGLKDKYFSLLKKAVSFSPITDIETFITEYVCDPQGNVNIGPMQENIIQYKKLENEAQLMQIRIDRLDEIENTFGAFSAHQENQDLFSFMIEKGEWNIEKGTYDSYAAQLQEAKVRLAAIDIDLADVSANISELDKKKYRLIGERVNSDAYKLTDELEEARKTNEEKYNALKLEITKVSSNLTGYCDTYIRTGQDLLSALNKIDFSSLEEDRASDLRMLSSSIGETIKQSTHLKEVELVTISNLDFEHLSSWKDTTTNLKGQLSALGMTLGRTIVALDQRTSLLKQQEIDMKTGGKPYDFALTAIKNELSSILSQRHKKNVEVAIFADLIDISRPMWANAIEGYLSNQKFNLLVENDLYLEAYEILKTLLEKHHFYGTQLVDTGAIIARNYQVEKNSLAEEISTDHIGAEAYISFLLGRLKKCTTSREARESGNGITPETDIYRNFTMGRLHPNSYRTHFIGRSISGAQLVTKRSEIERNSSLVNSYRQLQTVVNQANSLETINSFEVNASMTTLKRSHELVGLEQTLTFIKGELSKHDLSQLATYDQRLADIDEDINGLNRDKASLLEEKGSLANQIEHLINEKMPNEKKKVAERELRLTNNYDPFFVSEKGDPLFKKCVEKGQTYLQIVSEYNTQLSHVQYLVSNIFNQLVKLRRDYVRDYRLSFDPDMKDNIIFHQELVELRDVKLPQYQEKIQDAYRKATKQFKDDFIFKLRSAIDSVIDQIEDLNLALIASKFGNDSYQFTVKPSMVYRRYYDMIKDDMLLSLGEDDSPFIQKYDAVMNDLFKQIVDVGNGDPSGALLNNVAKFTDYRSYLDFDLLVFDKEGVSQHLSKMIKKKSGGETQTPFYISVLASFAQLYRINDKNDLSNCIRIIIFDEAFSKMDRGRIQEAVRLLRKFGLQAILSAPSEKVSDISSMADQTLVVLHDKNASRVHLYAEKDKVQKD